MDALRSGECDVALSLEASFEPFHSDAIAKTPLLDDRMLLVLPGDHPLAHKRDLRLEDLAEESFIQGAIGTCPDTAILLRAASAAGFEPRIAFQSNDYTAIQGFIATGVGVGLIPDLALVSVRDDIVIRDLGPQAPFRRIFAATLDGGYQAPAAAAMLEILATVGREYENGRRKLALAS
jgi:DNA-binding transcriptional LysR family regulator